jgi:hypothetical protein
LVFECVLGGDALPGARGDSRDGFVDRFKEG